MLQGKVKWFNAQKGYGFIEQKSGQDLFVHQSALRGKSLKEGDWVEFEIGQGPKGAFANNVRVV